MKTIDFLQAQLGVNIVLNDYRRKDKITSGVNFIDPYNRKLKFLKVKKFETRRYFVSERQEVM